MNIKQNIYNFNLNKFQAQNSTQKKYLYQSLERDVVSFSRRTAIPIQEQIMSLQNDDYLSEGLRNYIVDNISSPENTKNIVELHKEYYSGLINCKTLDEAKELYPEFESVVDAAKSNNDRVCKIISLGESNGLTPENASLELLKSYCGELTPLRDEAAYFNIERHSMSKLLQLLNIKISKNYLKVIRSQKTTDRNIKNWQNQEYRDNASKKATENWQNSEYVENQNRGREENNVKNKISGLAKSEASKRHPEFTTIRKEVAKNFKNLKFILEKKSQKKKLSGIEKSILYAFYRDCLEYCPDMNKVIGNTQQKVLKEWGYYGKSIEECNELYQTLLDCI